jgi:hypothetical protein
MRPNREINPTNRETKSTIRELNRPSSERAATGLGADAGSARHRLLSDKAAVDDEFGAGDERGFIGGEKTAPTGDLDRLADAQ